MSPGSSRSPRAELALDVDLARRHAVGQRRLERPRRRSHRAPASAGGESPRSSAACSRSYGHDHQARVDRYPSDRCTTPPSFNGSRRFSSAVGSSAFAPASSLDFSPLLLPSALLISTFSLAWLGGMLMSRPSTRRWLHVFVVETDDGGVDVEGLDRDQRRIVAHPAAPDAQVGAFDAKAGKRAQVQVAQLDVTVELVGQVADDPVAESIRRQRVPQRSTSRQRRRRGRPDRPTPRTMGASPCGRRA